MKELNAFRKFMTEGKGSTVKLSKSDMDKLHKDGEIEVDDHIIQFGEGEENVSENALANDKGDGTFEVTPDIEIMGEKFNFSDICPSAHKLVQNQALVYQGHSRILPTVLSFAIRHKNFFNLERKALGPQGITVDEFNDEVKRLYVEILNIAEKLGVRKQAKEYMDMHMAKIKDAGFKASEPGGSSDYKADNDYYMDETGDPDEFLEEAIEEVRNRLGDVVEGYTDLHKNDVALESFLGEEELNEESKVEYQVHYTVLKGKDASKGVASYDDKDDARKFYNDMVNDEEVVSAKIRKIIGRDPNRDTMGGFARHQGSEIDLEKYIHPAYFKKDRELEGQDKNIKMFLGTPSYILKKRGFTSDSPYFEEGLEEGMSDGWFNDSDEKTIMGHAREAATEAGALEPKFSPKLGGIMVRFPHSSGPSGAALTAMGQRTMAGQILDDTKRAATHAGEMFIDLVKEDPTLPQLEQDLLVVEYGPGEIAQVIVIPF